jgi:hypothetical protein
MHGISDSINLPITKLLLSIRLSGALLVSNPYAASFSDLQSVRRIAETYGFCLVKNVYSPEQMETLARGLETDNAAFEGNFPELMTCPSLRWAVVEPRVLAIARTLMPGPLYYYGESHVNYETEIGPRTKSPFAKMHFDARGTPNSLDAFWSSPTDQIFRGYRFGVYLQNYKQWSGGLLVIAGSHRGALSEYGGGGATIELDFKLLVIDSQSFTVGWPKKDVHIVPTEPGDLVIWNLRTMHSAGARRLAERPDLAMLPAFEKQIYEKFPNIFRPQPGPRNAFFFDYGTPTEEVDLYIKHRSFKLTPERLEQVADWRYDDDAVESIFKAKDIGIRFDPIITYLSTQVDAMHKLGATDSEIQDLRERLFALLERHEEFSPYFPLFSKDQFKRLAAQSRDEAVNYAVKSIQERAAGAMA